MKRITFLFTLTLSMLLFGCLTNNNRFIFGPAYHGKNKVLKTAQAEQIASSDNQKWAPTEEKPLVGFVDTASRLSLIDSSQSPFKLIQEKRLLADSAKVVERVKRTQKKIEQTARGVFFTPKQQKHEPKGDSEVAGKIILVILLIILGVILLGILIFALLLAALDKALEDAIAEACYVATMAYGSYDHPKVKTLRTFRDEYLKKKKWGKKFIRVYYKYSPKLVKKLQHKPLVNGVIRGHLNLFVLFLRRFYK